MANFWNDNPDLRFQFDHLDWDRLVDATEKLFPGEDSPATTEDAKAMFRDILEAMGEYIANEIDPHSQELDEQHPELMKNGEVKEPERMGKIMKGLAELGAMALAQPRRAGGMNAPIVVGNMVMEMLARADVSVMSHFGFHAGIGQALALYSLEEGSCTIEDGKVVASRFDKEIEAIAQGKEWGAMVLTEPDAGSDLAKIRAKAILQEDGSWKLTGQKIFITSGHGQHHIVIARTEDEKTHPGLKGLSLFYVPSHIDKDGEKVRNFEIGGVEHKMGQHSAVAATLHFEDAYAELMGQRGHGFKGMLLLMNNARVAVGFEALGIMEAAYRQSLAYAEDRVTMGKPISRHEMIADYLDEMELYIHGLRAMTFTAAFHEEIAQRETGYLRVNPPADDLNRTKRTKEIRRHKKSARRFTPLIKYVGGEQSVHVARMNMQILGGIGYIVETGAEKLLRDALVIPVYEGTSQIQALMCLKDTMQRVLRNPRKFYAVWASARIDAVRARDPLDKLLARLRSVGASATNTILTNIAADKFGEVRGRPVMEWKDAFVKDWDPNKDFSFGLLHAERLTQILSWEAMATVLVEQAKQSRGTEAENERRDIAERFLERFEVKARGVLGEIDASGSLLSRLTKRAHGEEDAA